MGTANHLTLLRLFSLPIACLLIVLSKNDPRYSRPACLSTCLSVYVSVCLSRQKPMYTYHPASPMKRVGPSISTHNFFTIVIEILNVFEREVDDRLFPFFSTDISSFGRHLQRHLWINDDKHVQHILILHRTVHLLVCRPLDGVEGRSRSIRRRREAWPPLGERACQLHLFLQECLIDYLFLQLDIFGGNDGVCQRLLGVVLDVDADFEEAS